jgi:hypothetical protein
VFALVPWPHIDCDFAPRNDRRQGVLSSGFLIRFAVSIALICRVFSIHVATMLQRFISRTANANHELQR